MTPALTNNPLFRGITPEKLSANLEEISFHTRSYRTTLYTHLFFLRNRHIKS